MKSITKESVLEDLIKNVGFLNDLKNKINNQSKNEHLKNKITLLTYQSNAYLNILLNDNCLTNQEIDIIIVEINHFNKSIEKIK